MLDSFKENLNAKAPGQFTYSFFNAQGDLKRLINYVTQVIHSYTIHYDAIMAVGSSAAQIASRMTLFLNIPIPVVFTNVANPVHAGVIYAGSKSKRNITGVASPLFDHEAQVQMLGTLKQSTQRILLPFDPNFSNLLSQSLHIHRLLQSNGIEVIPVQTPSPEELDRQLAKHVQSVDTLITLRDSVIINNMSSIIKTCNNYGVTVYSSDLKSVELGAALGFAAKEGKTGEEAAQYFLNLFEHDAQPHELPVTTTQLDYVVGINSETSRYQGVNLDDETINSIERKIIFNKHNNEKKPETTT